MKTKSSKDCRRWPLFVVGLLVLGLASVTGVPISAQTLTVDPPLSEPTTTAFTVDVDIATGGFLVKGVHVVMSYDPTVVQLAGIDPGTWVTDAGAPGSSYFFWDFTPQVAPGVLAFDVSFLGDPVTGQGQAAVCRFTALRPGESPLDFVEIDVRDPENQPLPFDTSTGDLIRIAASMLYFDPSTSTPLTPEFTVDLAITGIGRQIKGAEVIVEYDPTIVQLDGIDAGSWVIDQELQYFFWDFTSQSAPGVLHCDVSFLDGTGTGNGVLAVCRFSAVEIGISPLDFISIDVRDDQNQPIPFDHSLGDQIIIDEAIRTEPVTLGAIKSRFR